MTSAALTSPFGISWSPTAAMAKPRGQFAAGLEVEERAVRARRQSLVATSRRVSPRLIRLS